MFLCYSGSREVRCVGRNLLLEALANELPSGTIRYMSKVVAIQESGFSKILHLADGTTIKTKVIREQLPLRVQVISLKSLLFAICGKGIDWV